MNPFQGFSFSPQKQPPPTSQQQGCAGPLQKSNGSQINGSSSNTTQRTQIQGSPDSFKVKAGVSKNTQKGQSKKAATKVKVKNVTQNCEVDCRGVKEKLGGAPLRLILVGHNPSQHAWKTGHYYSNPNNFMWRILKKVGLAYSTDMDAEQDNLMPQKMGVGFCDVGVGFPGTDSSKFSAQDFIAWKLNFYQKLNEHLEQASKSIGCTCGMCGAPAYVAFTGKRQYMELYNVSI